MAPWSTWPLAIRPTASAYHLSQRGCTHSLPASLTAVSPFRVHLPCCSQNSPDLFLVSTPETSASCQGQAPNCGPQGLPGWSLEASPISPSTSKPHHPTYSKCNARPLSCSTVPKHTLHFCAVPHAWKRTVKRSVGLVSSVWGHTDTS